MKTIPVYPAGTMAALVAGKNVTAPTRRALQERMARPQTTTPRFFDNQAFATLHAVCARLIPPFGSNAQVDVAGQIDSALAEGVGNGWRYDTMPPDGQAYVLGLYGVDQTADAIFNMPFAQIDSGQQDSVLRSVQQGNAPGTVWQTVPAALFFEELLALAVEVCYAHPLVQESIGYAGMADAPGWQLIGLNQLEAREPRPLPLPLLLLLPRSMQNEDA